MRRDDDARAHPRYVVEAAVDVTPGPDAPAQPASELDTPERWAPRVQNLSLGGICLETHMPAQVGDVVEIELGLPDRAERLRVRGQVVWANREPPADLGLRFIDLEPATARVLASYLEAARGRS